MLASCASCRMRSNMREASDSLSRPSSSNARWRVALALVTASPWTSDSTARRTRSNASARVRRSPLRPMASDTSVLVNVGAMATGASAAGAARSPPSRSAPSRRSRNRSRPRPRRRPRSRPSPRLSAPSLVSAPSSPGSGRMPSDAITAFGSTSSATGVAISAVSSSATSDAASAAGASPSRGSPSRGSRSRSKRSRPRPRRPRRPRRSSRASRDSSAGAAAFGATVSLAAATGATVPSGTSTSSWPLSSFVTLIRPRCCASCTKRENFGCPRFFSSNDASISCITCLRRSLRITSLLRFMRPSASVTSSHGSQRVVSSSPLFTRPARALYE